MITLSKQTIKKNNYWIVFHSEPAIAFGFGFRFVAFLGLRTQTLNLQNNKGPHFVQHIWNQYITLFYYFCSKQLSCRYINKATIGYHVLIFSFVLSCLFRCIIFSFPYFSLFPDVCCCVCVWEMWRPLGTEGSDWTICLAGGGGRLTPQSLCCNHRRRTKTEEKAKVVASVWGKELIQFLAALAVLHCTIWIIGWIAPGWVETKDEFILFF